MEDELRAGTRMNQDHVMITLQTPAKVEEGLEWEEQIMRVEWEKAEKWRKEQKGQNTRRGQKEERKSFGWLEKTVS